MDEYRNFLAEQVITEDRVVTYRYLSRALKVHVNSAKQMLYEFHRAQNATKPGSIHATYLVYGTKTADSSSGVQEDGDVEMGSSMPEAESLSEEVPTMTLSLLQEKQLEDALLKYDDVVSIHVYSIGPHPANDLEMIADANRQMLQLPTEGEPTKLDQNYGTIANSHAHRRERQGSGPKPTMATAQTTQTTQTAKPSIRDAVSKPMPSALTAEEPKESKATTTEAPAKKPVPSLKRGGSSGIMQAFAKGAAAAKPKKQQNSQQAAPIKAEESPVMTLSDDDEDDAEDIPQPKAAADQEVGRKSRKEREDQLRRMMDEEDSDDDDDDDDEKEDTPMEDAEEPEEPVEAPPAPAPKTEGPAEVVSASTGDGRRRGKRRVMRKKQVMDDQGYLVTMQEPGWESFSEEEKVPSTKSSQAVSSQASSQPAKPKKTAAKGQGSIMSFFGKK